MNSILKNPFFIPAVLFSLLLGSYAVFENVEKSHSEQVSAHPQDLMDESLDAAGELYQEIHNDLISTTGDLYREVRELIETDQNRQFINQALQSPSLWGTMLQRDGTPWSWSGFHLTAPASFTGEETLSIQTSIQRRNNVVYLMARTEFVFNENSYRLLTATKLQQVNNLEFSAGTSFDLADHPRLSDKFPVNFSFFSSPSQGFVSYRALSTTTSDTAAFVYADPDDLELFEQIHDHAISEWRTLFHIGLFTTLLILFLVFILQRKNFFFMVVQLTTVVIIWYMTVKWAVFTDWIRILLADSSGQGLRNSLLLTEYFVHALFLNLMAFISIVHFKNTKSDKDGGVWIQGLLYSFLYGIGCLILLLFFILQTEELLLNSGIPLLDLELIPSAETFIFYLSASLLMVAVSGIIVSIGFVLFKQKSDTSILVYIASIFGFLLTAFALDQFTAIIAFTGWVFLTAFLLFVTLLIISSAVAALPDYFSQLSGFRRMMIGLFIATISIYVVVWQATSTRIETDLFNVATEYSQETENNAEEILRTLLTSLEQRLRFLSTQDLDESPASVQVQFHRAIQSQMEPAWQDFLFDIQLIRTDGEQISEYSTSLDSPGWTALFDTDIMISAYHGEQLRRETNRPVVQGRPGSIPEDFRAFYRGWIPIYETNTDGSSSVVAWIFGAIYQERPNFNKPLRAVLAAATGDDWKRSFYMAEFQNSRVSRSAVLGMYTDQPEYNRLSGVETTIAMQDSIAYLTTLTNQGAFREILMHTGNQNIIKVSTPKPGFNNHLFSFFRLQIVLVFFGLFMFVILGMLGFRWFVLFGQSRKFQHRLIDGLTLATLLFLTALIFATQYVVENQSEKNIERELVSKLKNLGESVQTEVNQPGGSFSIPLSELAFPFNVDAILYRNVWVSASTTPQIFQQHLLPRVLPYNVYEFLFNRERRHVVTSAQLGNEELLIGYRAILDNNNVPVGVIAIPTFVQSPLYTEQLLETTSYLFAIYLGIFTLFIFGSVILSNRLTRPLQMIQQGLNKISRGERQTMIDISSKDEIGSLASAYNQMVERLDEAQKELIKAERESAWKEMAQQVAHEIKNPLTPMKLNLQHLQRQLEANPQNVLELKPQIQKTADNIIEQIESLNKIASDFSKFARPIREPFKPVNVSKLLDSVKELYAHDDNITVTVKLQKRDTVIYCVEDEIRRALINLIKNGIEATESKGCTIQIVVQKQSTEIVIRVIDFGSGIPKENHNQIFVPNFSTKSSGTGLGLAITKKIIDAHGGSIYFSSKIGKGTTFTIKLPIRPDLDPTIS